MSAVSTNLCFLNLASIVNKSSSMVGPVIKASLSESLVEFLPMRRRLSVILSSGYLSFAPYGEAGDSLRLL